jgi:hypothetical protein
MRSTDPSPATPLASEADGPEEFDLNDQRAAFVFLEEERRRLGMSLTQMEARSGVSVNSTYSWRNCERSPTIQNMVKIADCFDFEIILRKKI